MILPNPFLKEGYWENSGKKNLLLSKDKMFMQQRQYSIKKLTLYRLRLRGSVHGQKMGGNLSLFGCTALASEHLRKQALGVITSIIKKQEEVQP